MREADAWALVALAQVSHGASDIARIARAEAEKSPRAGFYLGLSDLFAERDEDGIRHLRRVEGRYRLPARILVAQALERRGRLDEALATVEEAVAAARRTGNEPLIAWALAAEAEAAVATGDRERALAVGRGRRGDRRQARPEHHHRDGACAAGPGVPEGRPARALPRAGAAGRHAARAEPARGHLGRRSRARSSRSGARRRPRRRSTMAAGGAQRDPARDPRGQRADRPRARGVDDDPARPPSSRSAPSSVPPTRR